MSVQIARRAFIFLCATPQIQISSGFQQSLGAGIFGGDGLVLQHVSGMGTAWIELSGELIMKDLAAGENVAGSSGTRRRVPGEPRLLARSAQFSLSFRSDPLVAEHNSHLRQFGV